MKDVDKIQLSKSTLSIHALIVGVFGGVISMFITCRYLQNTFYG